jgi:hypothetical protein
MSGKIILLLEKMFFLAINIPKEIKLDIENNKNL